MKKEAHNGIISFWKFMFSLMICAIHLGSLYEGTKYNFAAGSIAVEFFFIVSGYLFCKKCLQYNKDKNEEIINDNLKMAWNSIKRFFPYVLFLMLISVGFCRIILYYRGIDFIYALYNILLIPVRNMTICLPYSVMWYLPALIIIEFVIFPLLVKNKEKYSLYIAPIIFFLLLGYILIKFGNFASPWKRDVFTLKSIVRGFMDMNLGIFIYVICEKFKNIKFNNFSKYLLTIIEVIGYTSIFVLCNKPDAHNKYDALMLLIISISVLISFSGNSKLNKIANNKFFYYLEKLSLPIYINNWFTVLLCKHLINKFKLNFNYYEALLFTIVVLILFAVIETFIIKIYNNKKDKLKKLFINE